MRPQKRPLVTYTVSWRDSFHEESSNAVKEESLKTSKQGVIAALEGMKERPDREVLLHFAPYPFLFIAGKNDPVFPFEVLEDQIQAHRVTPLHYRKRPYGAFGGYGDCSESGEEFLRENS